MNSLLAEVRKQIEEVEAAFDSSVYQSSYETKLHDKLKKALEKLDELERET